MIVILLERLGSKRRMLKYVCSEEKNVDEKN